MEKKYVVGGSVAAFLAGLGLFGIANEASKEVAATPPAAIEAPLVVDPNNPITPDQLPQAPEEPCVEQSGKPCDERTWGEWIIDMVPGLGDTKDEETPNDIINRNLGR